MQVTEIAKSGKKVVSKAIDSVEGALAAHVAADAAVDAVTLLKGQHREVDALFAEVAAAGDKAFKTKEKLVATIIEKLTVHAQIEEKIFYPAAREADEDLVLESFEEHANVKAMLRKLSGLDASDQTFDAKVTVLKELVQHHVKEEEDDLFPKCKKALGDERLQELGTTMEASIERMEARQQGGAKPSKKARKH